MPTPKQSDSTQVDCDDAYLSIVPSSDDLVPESEVCDEMSIAPPPAPAAQSPEPAPKKRSGLLMFLAGAMGGGVVVGGGGAVLGLLAGAMFLLMVAFGGVFWLMSGGESVEPVAIEDELIVDEEDDAVVDADEEVAAKPAPTGSTPRSATGGSTGGTDRSGATPSPAPAAPASPAPSTPSSDPTDLEGVVTIKVLSDPPGAVLWLDGQSAGRTPAKLEVDPGSHSLTIESGKARGTFPIDAGLGGDRFCFTAKGKKLSSAPCS